MTVVYIGDETPPGQFMDALAPDTRRHAADWPPYSRPDDHRPADVVFSGRPVVVKETNA